MKYEMHYVQMVEIPTKVLCTLLGTIIIILWIAMKCAASLSSFVNRSARLLVFLAMWRMSMKLAWIDSQMTFLWIWMRQSPLVVIMLCDQHTYALLLLY